jgi:drug/metabolite transporter (DMT)-like permease
MVSIPGKTSSWATALLIFVTFIWGFTFVTNQYILKTMTVADLMAWRFLIAAGVMVVAKPSAMFKLPKAQLRQGIILGLLLSGGYLAQMAGLKNSDLTATASGFITGMFVVLTPLISGFLLHQRIHRNAWIAVALATLGLGLIALKGWSFGHAEAVTFVCALLFAFHIAFLARWSQPEHVFALTTVQLSVVAVFSLAFSLIKGGPHTTTSTNVWICIVLLAVLASCLGFFAQTWVQSHVSATRAAIILTMEPVFAGLAGVTIGTDDLTPKLIIGALCILAAMYLVELTPQRDTHVLPIEM